MGIDQKFVKTPNGTHKKYVSNVPTVSVENFEV